MLIDSHCHLDRLDLEKYQGDLSKALDHAREVGIEYFLSICVDLNELPNILNIAKAHDDISCSIGVHPSDVAGEVVLAETLIRQGQDDKIVAVGETGLDYYRNEPATVKTQQESFRQHIRAAKALNKPLVIHTRFAIEDTLRIMREEKAHTIGGVMHCFTENWESAQQALDENFYISLSGIVTFKNAEQVKSLAKQVPMDRLLVETDSPYLAPMPYRGKSNEPAYVYYVAKEVAALREITFEEVAVRTTENFYRLFRLNRHGRDPF